MDAKRLFRRVGPARSSGFAREPVSAAPVFSAMTAEPAAQVFATFVGLLERVEPRREARR